MKDRKGTPYDLVVFLSVMGSRLSTDDDIALHGKAVEGFKVLNEKHQWISVNDRLPEAEGNYLVYRSFSAGGTLIEIMEIVYFKKGLFYEFDNDMNRHKVDAKSWQPLPAPPKAEQ